MAEPLCNLYHGMRRNPAGDAQHQKIKRLGLKNGKRFADILFRIIVRHRVHGYEGNALLLKRLRSRGAFSDNNFCRRIYFAEANKTSLHELSPPCINRSAMRKFL